MTTNAEDDDASVNSDVAVAKPRRGRRDPYIPPEVQPTVFSQDVEAATNAIKPKPDPPETGVPRQDDEEDDEATEVGFDDASDVAIAKPRRGRGALLGGTSITAAAALADEDDVESARRHRRAPKTKPPKTQANFDKVSNHTALTSSFDLNESEDDEGVESNGVPSEEDDTLNVLSTTYSLFTLHTQERSVQDSTPEKDVRDSTLAVGSLPEAIVPTRRFCGMTKYKWALVITAICAGFVVGFSVPFLKPEPRPVTAEEASQATDTTYIGLQDDDAVDPPQVHSNPPEATTPSPSPIPSQTTNTIPVDDEETISFQDDTIDVWNVFGNTIASLPSLSVEYLAQSSLELSNLHVEAVAKRFVQGTIHSNIRKPKLALQVQKGTSPLEGEYVVPFIDTPLSAFDGLMPYPTARTASDSTKYPHGDVASWEAYLADLKVRESDTVQWDPENDVLYVAHGKHIDVVDTKAGSVRATIHLPMPVDRNEHEMDAWLVSGESDGWKPAPPEPFIDQLLLTSTKDHLVVIVSDYSHIHQARVKPLLKESLVTRVFTYELSHKGNITEYEWIGKAHSIHGRILHAAEAASGRHIHFITSSGIETSRLLQDPLERLYFPDGHDKNYVTEVAQAAQDKYIPLFVRRLQSDVEGEDINLMPLTHWITGDDGALTEEERQLEQVVTAQDQMKELVVVTSFSIVDTNDLSATARQGSSATKESFTSIFSTAFLGPSNVQVLGSTDTHVTLSVPGYQWSTSNEGIRVLQEATHFLQWELGTVTVGGSHQAATRFQATGTVPGRLVQSPRQSIQYYGDELRVATVLTSQWKVDVSNQDDQPVVAESLAHKSFVNVLDKVTLQALPGSPLQLFQENPLLLSAVTFFDDVAYAFPMQPSSPTKVDQALVQVVGLGKEVDPDSAEPALQILGSISPIPNSFSRFLHKLPTNDGKDLLLSIGHNQSDFGLMNGWILTVWDVTNPTEMPSTPLVQYSLEPEDTIVTWQPNTFQVTTRGQVILPMTVEYVGSNAGLENMKGFVVLEVSATEIKETARVAHSQVVMSSGECPSGDGGCGLEGKSFWKAESGQDYFTSLLTVEGTTVKLTTLSQDFKPNVFAWSLSLP